MDIPFRIIDEHGVKMTLTQVEGQALIGAGLVKACPNHVPGPHFHHPVEPCAKTWIKIEQATGQKRQ